MGYYYRMPASQRVAVMGGASYLLDAEFSDTRAAGAVNGTPATPGPGTQAVVDTDSKLSIGSGVLTLAAHSTPAWANPGYWLDAVTRTEGRMLVAQITPAVNNTHCKISLAGVQSGNPGINALYFSSTGIQANPSAGVTPVVGSYSTATSYLVALVLQKSGLYYFIKGGAFTTWTLLYRAPAESTATLYPGFATYNATLTGDFIRVPARLWLPTPLAYDTFTRANGVLGSTETTGPNGQGCAARAWTDSVGTWAIAADVATCSVLAGGIGIATVETNTVSTFISAVLTRAGNEVGVVLRYVDADNYVRAIHDGTNCKLIKRVAAVETTVISAAAALGAGRIIVISDGTSFSLYLNDAKIGTTQTISDAALQTGTSHGLYTTNVGNTLDALLVFPRGSNGEYADLDRWSGVNP